MILLDLPIPRKIRSGSFNPLQLGGGSHQFQDGTSVASVPMTDSLNSPSILPYLSFRAKLGE